MIPIQIQKLNTFAVEVFKIHFISLILSIYSFHKVCGKLCRKWSISPIIGTRNSDSVVQNYCNLVLGEFSIREKKEMKFYKFEHNKN